MTSSHPGDACARSQPLPGDRFADPETVTQADDIVVFEQPLNERIRTLLRLEFLFAQHAHHRADSTPFGLRARLAALLDVLTVLSRSDLKKDIFKELQEQHAALTRLNSRPGVDPERLRGVLHELRPALAAIQPLATQHAAGSVLRASEFLIAIYNRSAVPGGTCAFDLPGYHYWLSQPVENARRDLDAWFADLEPFERGIQLYLRLLRGSTEAQSAVARDGVYVHAPQGPCSLARVFVPVSLGLYPEISAGAHRFTIRFMSFPDARHRGAQAVSAVPFRLQCCAL